MAPDTERGGERNGRVELPETGGGSEQRESVFPAGGGTTLARFDRPRGSGTTLAVVADPHLTPTDRGSFNVYHRTKQRFQMAVADAHRLDVDGFLVAGDLTKDGATEEFALADELLSAAPAPTLAVPGNHDLDPGGEPSAAAFAERYAGGEYPVTREVGGTTVSLLDSTHPDGTDTVAGGLDAAALLGLANDGVTAPRVAVVHHALAPLPAPVDTACPAAQYRLREPAATADALADAGVELVVTGHAHWPYATTYRGLGVVGAPSGCSFPPAYLLLHFDAVGTTVSIMPLADEAGLTEAYEFAVTDDRRGDAVRAAVIDGYFGRFPVVEEWEPRAVADGPAVPSARN